MILKYYLNDNNSMKNPHFTDDESEAQEGTQSHVMS